MPYRAMPRGLRTLRRWRLLRLSRTSRASDGTSLTQNFNLQTTDFYLSRIPMSRRADRDNGNSVMSFTMNTVKVAAGSEHAHGSDYDPVRWSWVCQRGAVTEQIGTRRAKRNSRA